MIQTDRLSLRPFEDTDSACVVAILNDLNVSRWLATVPHPFTENDLRFYTPEGQSRWPDLAAITLAGEVVGAVSAEGSLGYWLAPAHGGKGIATEATRAMVRHYFDRTGQGVLKAGYFEGNVASAKVLEKLGFQEQNRGTQFCTALQRDLPHVSVALTRTDWQRV